MERISRSRATHGLVSRICFHPAIPTKNPDLRIADIGTGTGTWLTDLADELPKSARRDAMDISFAATPLLEMLPPNVSLQPMGREDRRTEASEPGGYIQWTDIDISSLRLEKIRPDIQADAQVKLMNQFKGNENRLDSAWVPTLAKRFADNELTDVITDAREAPPHLALALHEVGLLATEVLTRNKASSGNEEACGSGEADPSSSCKGDSRWIVLGLY
ncbi:hypothetical protein ABOM_011940 [Aspergillus bombycis]|uniref:Methyltransferase domain-containing protein n=1 Tax=Aspergillus bombycis TaxID=109264 RepID=A0A1F7ZK67_9EURO|nr:hypothetical protein ABOM_011940 [Aspergillus bombycis]OGM39518.1 hypothetical protein ABOM_011940 [Aspergillus bombycis]